MSRIELYADAPALTGGEYVPVSVLVDGQYVTRRVTAQSIANKAPASGGGGGAADPVDGIRTWLSPYNVGATNTASSNVAGINSAISAASSVGTSARVLLPQGTIPVNGSIILRSGVELIGQGPGANGTTLALASGSNCNVIQDTYWVSHADYLDGAAVSNLRIDGNKAGNASGSGIAVYAMGEDTTIQRVNIRNCVRYALEFTGPALTARIASVTSVNCGWGTIWISGTDGCYVFDAVRAELGGPLFSGAGSVSVSAVLNGCRQDDCGANHVISLASWDGSVVVNGGVFLAAAKTTNALAAFTDTNSDGNVAFAGPVFQHNFLRHITDTKDLTKQRQNIDFITTMPAAGGWVPSLVYPGVNAALLSGIRWNNEGLSEFASGMTSDAAPAALGAPAGGFIPGGTTYGTIRDPYTNSTTTGWIIK